MNRDHIAATALVALTLLSFANPLFLLAVIPTGAYGGWRLGHRLIEPEGS